MQRVTCHGRATARKAAEEHGKTQIALLNAKGCHHRYVFAEEAGVKDRRVVRVAVRRAPYPPLVSEDSVRGATGMSSSGAVSPGGSISAGGIAVFSGWGSETVSAWNGPSLSGVMVSFPTFDPFKDRQSERLSFRLACKPADLSRRNRPGSGKAAGAGPRPTWHVAQRLLSLWRFSNGPKIA